MASNHKATHCHNHEFISRKCLLLVTLSLHILDPGSDRTRIAWLDEERIKKAKEEENWGNWAFRLIMDRVLGKGRDFTEILFYCSPL